MSIKLLVRLAFFGVLPLFFFNIAYSQFQFIPKSDKFFEVRESTANIEQTLFQLRYAAQPLCLENSSWSHGGFVYTVPAMLPLEGSARLLPYIEDTNKKALLIQQKYGAKPDQRVVISNQPLTPLGLAGLVQGDIFVPSESLLSVEPLTPGPRSSGADAIERQKKAAIEEDKRYSSNPIQELSIFKNANSSSVPVRMVKVCNLLLSVLDSKYSYAHSRGNSLFVTLPFLASASVAEITSMLSVETAHSALGYGNISLGGELAIAFFLGRVADLGKNIETNVRPTQENDLIEVDRLAMALAFEMGVGPAEFIAALKKFDAVRTGIGQPDYAQTRPMTVKRSLSLEESAASWASSQRFPLAKNISPEIQESIISRLRQAMKKPADVFSVSALNFASK